MERARKIALLFLIVMVVSSAIAVTNHYKGGRDQASNHYPLRSRVEVNHNMVYALFYDPLYRECPNRTLSLIIVNTLEDYGYKVDVYEGSNATLNPLLNLGKYSLIIIRAHGGFSDNSLTNYPKGEYIFTGIYYNESLLSYGTKIMDWIKAGYLALGIIPSVDTNISLNKLPKYIVVGPKFFEEKTTLRSNSIVFIFGCYTFEDGTLAHLLIKKGALVYIGWNGNVTVSYMDYILPYLVESYLSHGITGLQKAVRTVAPDPYSGSVLKIYLRNT